jgi:hypothetical protein
MTQLIVTDGANAKSINPWNLEDRPEAWTWLSNAPQSELDAMFYKVAASFRAVNKRAIAAANVPFQIKRGKTVIDDSTSWENKVGFLLKPKDLIKRISLSLTFTNKAYLLRGKDVLSQTKSLKFLVPTTIQEITSPVTGELTHFERWVNARQEKYLPTDKDFIHIWLLDHTTELLPSKNTSAQAIFNSVGQVYFADLFVRHFYERGGVKPTVLALKGAVFNERKEEIERGWNRFLRNLSTFSAKILNADTMQVEPIGAGVDDLKNNEVYRQAIENIALGIGMPTSHLLSDWDSYATATVDYMMWQRDDIFPLVEAIAEDLNIQVFKPLGLTLEFQTEMSDAETQDEVDRAKAYQIYIDAGIKPSIAAQMVGIELPDGVEYDMLDEMAEEREKKDLEKEQRDRDTQMELQAAKNPPEPQPAPKPAAKWLPSVDEFKELSVWRDVALRRLKKGDSLDFTYEPHYGGLPDNIAETIIAELTRATSAEEVKAAFDVDFETETVTPAPVYKSDPGIIELAKSLNALTDAYVKSLQTTPAPQPNINVTLPPITMTANLPEQKEASITFSPNIQPAPVTVENIVNVPEQPAPVNEITVQPADVKLSMPKPKKEKQRIKRDKSTGLIESTETEIEY